MKPSLTVQITRHEIIDNYMKPSLTVQITRYEIIDNYMKPSFHCTDNSL